MKNIDYLFDQMMSITQEFDKPKASIHRLLAKSGHIQGVVHAASVVKYVHRFEKVKPTNRIFDTSSGVPESILNQEDKNTRIRASIKTAAKVLARRSAEAKKEKAAA